MKKLLIAAFAAFLLFAAGCSGAPAAETFDADKPWGTPTHAFEKSVYSLEVFERVEGKDEKGKKIYVDGGVLANGSLTQTLTAEGEGLANRATVNSSLAVLWKDVAAAGENRAKEDFVTGNVVFATGDCTPVSSKKTAVLADRTKDGTVKNDSYEFSADYAALKADIKSGTDQKELALKSGLQYDNEQLFYLLRAFKNIKSEASLSFTLNSVYDNYLQDRDHKKIAPFPMTASVAAEPVSLTLGDFILNYVDADPANPDADPRSIACYPVTVVINATDSGPAHRFYLTDPAIKFGKTSFKTSKLVAKYDYYVYDKNGIDQYHYVYTLTDYVTS